MTQEECLQILGLEKGYTDEQLKEAYLTRAQVWHPDRFENNEKIRVRAEKEMKRINEANDALKSKKYTYSKAPSSPPPPQPSSPQTPRTSPPSRPSPPPPTSQSNSVNDRKTVKPVRAIKLERAIQVTAFLIIIIIEIRIAYKAGSTGLIASLAILGVYYFWLRSKKKKRN